MGSDAIRKLFDMETAIDCASLSLKYKVDLQKSRIIQKQKLFLQEYKDLCGKTKMIVKNKKGEDEEKIMNWKPL